MSELDTHEGISDTDVAVIGMSGRFPRAPNIETFWKNLLAGKEGVRWYTEDELRESGVPEETLRLESYVRAYADLADVEMFDASFFSLTPRQVALMDPQFRLLLECSWEALEDAGYAPSPEGSPVGVFVGASCSLLQASLRNQVGWDASWIRMILHNDRDFVATRISNCLNLTGPSLCIQTACSTSLVAVHTACQSLLAGECKMAVAGAAAIRQLRPHGYFYEPGSISSPDGHCRAFDSNAAGFVCGDGVGIVVLKLLRQALDDGDFIHAVIRGSAVNNDGARKLSYSAPSIQGQTEVISAALAVASIDPATVEYVEAHGTGTQLGDPVEVSALAAAYQSKSQRNTECLLGSVKSNIGHLDAAAGVAGLIKTCLIVRHGLVPPSLHFREPNPELRLDSTPFRVVDSVRTWTSPARRRRAGVSSFGMGGTNCHMLVEEPPPRKLISFSDQFHVLPISAQTPRALDRAVADLSKFLADTSADIASVAYTLQVGRRAFAHRQFVVANSCEQASRDLMSLRSDSSRVAPDASAEVALYFPDEDTVNVPLVRELASCEPALRSALERSCELLRRQDRPEPASMFLAETWNGDSSALRREGVLPLARLAVAYSMAKWWIEAGVGPRVIVANDVNELAIAFGRDAFSLDDVEFCRPEQCAEKGVQTLISVGECLRWGRGAALRAALGTAWSHGASISWAADPNAQRVRLPTYPFQREYFKWAPLG